MGKRKMPPYQYAIEIENGRTASENGMVLKGQQDWEQEIWQWVISTLFSPTTLGEEYNFCREIFMGLKLTHWWVQVH